MATTGPPFDKPMAELREAFVRARFAQEDVFGLPSIEAWLARQRKAERPAEIAWRRFIAAERVQRPFHIRELQDLTVPQELPRGFSIGQMADVGDPLVAILCESMDRRRVGVLPVDEKLTLFLLNGEDGAPAHAFTLVPQYNPKRRSGDPLAYTLSVPRDKDFLQAILCLGWSVGPKKIATAARRLLCDALKARIREERGKAEHDFDTAVAVSADGTKICSADWVCVFGASSTEPPPSDRHGLSDRSMFRATDHLFPASAFRERKILLTPRMVEEDGPPAAGPFTSPGPFKNTWAASNRSVDAVFKTPAPEHSYGKWYRMELAYARCHHPKQSLLVCKDGRILFVHRDQCPDPLPDGGAEMTA